MVILYIGPEMKTPMNGGDRIEYRNQKLLEQICEGHITYFSPDFRYTSLSAKLKMTIGMTKKKKEELKTMINTNSFNLIFVSQSTYGGYVRFIKSFCKIPIITFFHNAEIDYFITAHDTKKKKISGLHYIAKVIWCEFLSNKKSDKIITLNERDSIALNKYYKRGADFILPTTFEDIFDEGKVKNDVLDIDFLFVGSNFFANTQGLQWFIDKVLPHINGNLYIIGNGMDKYNFINTNGRVYIKGFVDDLTEYYNRAKVVISPIFCGSGMKTKTAEALMYGKIIVGTTEAFEGYVINPECMKLCNTSDEFVAALTQTVTSNKQAINMAARQHFKDHYCNESFAISLKLFLEETIREYTERFIS